MADHDESYKASASRKAIRESGRVTKSGRQAHASQMPCCLLIGFAVGSATSIVSILLPFNHLQVHQMSENAEDLTVNYEEDGVLVVQELDKEILSKGSWTTILFKYRDFDKTTQQYGPEKFIIRRYQKRNGQFQPKSKFTISSVKQAEKIVEILSRWIANPNI